MSASSDQLRAFAAELLESITEDIANNEAIAALTITSDDVPGLVAKSAAAVEALGEMSAMLAVQVPKMRRAVRKAQKRLERVS